MDPLTSKNGKLKTNKVKYEFFLELKFLHVSLKRNNEIIKGN